MSQKNQLTKLADFLSPCSCWVLTGGIIQCKEMNTHTASTHKHCNQVMTVQSKCMCVSVIFQNKDETCALHHFPLWVSSDKDMYIA